MISEGEVLELLQRIFHGGQMRRVPKKREDAEAILALAISGLDGEGLFEESEINIHLAGWLDGIAAEESLDHITLRRYLVDFGFLRRASDGVVYRIVPERRDEVLEESARAIDPKRVFSEVGAARQARRDAFRSKE